MDKGLIKGTLMASVLALSACSFAQSQVERVEGFGAKVEAGKVTLHCKRTYTDRVAYEGKVNSELLEDDPNGKTVYIRPICPDD